MERAQWNTTTMVPKGILGLRKNDITWERRADRKEDKKKNEPGEPVLFNVELLHDAVWGGETEWTALPVQRAAERVAWRKQPAFFNVELLHDAVWEG